MGSEKERSDQHGENTGGSPFKNPQNRISFFNCRQELQYVVLERIP